MTRPLALVSILSACVSVADAQPRPADAGGPRDRRHVVDARPGNWQPRCVASAGCEAPRAIPRCATLAIPAGEGPPITVAAAWNRRFDLSGQHVAIRGTLRAGGGCSEMACPANVCCNHCQGRIDLTEGRSALALDTDDAAAFGCRGDDSGLCCGTAVPTGTVVVRGTLRPIANSGGRYRIETPSLCVD
ncbi:MAG: hypothetical protein U0325_23365 [Polyangiales bacterium]